MPRARPAGASGAAGLLPGAEPVALDTGPDGRPAPAAVVLCHGFTGTPQGLRPWAEYLNTEGGLAVRVPLLPGHGTRWEDLADTAWTHWYAAVELAFDELRGLGVPVFAAGLSMGGALAVRLAEQRGDQVAGLILVNPSLASPRFDLRFLLPAVRALGVHRIWRSAPGIGNDIAKPDTTELCYPRAPLSAVYSLTRLWRAVRADLDRVRVPIRLYRSAVDHVVEPLSAQLLQAGVASTDVRERVLARSWHVATLDHDAEELFADSLAFISERTAALEQAGA